MNILFYDTETTGLPLNWKAHVHETNNWPRLVQLAWIIANNDGKILCHSNQTIYPEDYMVPAEASMIHGITTEKAMEVGLPIMYVMGQFMVAAALCNHSVGHNIGFDWKIVGAELLRAGLEDQYQVFKLVDRTCTMRKSTKFCGLKQRGSNRAKFPNLQELHSHLFGEQFEGAHDAMADVKATMRCYFELVDRDVIESKLP